MDRAPLAILLGSVIVFPGCLGALPGDATAPEQLRMSTTTSVDNTGLLDYLSPFVVDETGLLMRWHAVGSGQAVADGRLGNADVLLVHDPAAEARFVADGHGSTRLAVMRNEFLVLGPEADPAGLAHATNASDAFARIHAAKAPFASRGDDSGTHAREKLLWSLAGFNYTTDVDVDENTWYRSTGQGMGATLRIAAEVGAYVLSDDATFYAYQGDLALEILVRNDPPLDNHYSVMPVNETKHPGVNEKAAWAFAEWLTSSRGQSLIGAYKVAGRMLFTPEAGAVLA
ncbi:MAG: substrate-binding domain-containing protein [Euryarchaeota archaeon]|nr:substrate-binding domain-containing protein [Euryarchaeota archaeon]